MRQSIVVLITLAMCLLLAAPAVAVTDEELAAQRAVVAAEQATMDSLTSQSYADPLQATLEEDEVLPAYDVSVLVASRHPVSGVRDNSGCVDVDIPYSTWNAGDKALWDLQLQASGIDVVDVSTGRYIVHSAEVPALLALVRARIVAIIAE
jgi:hypothetical protein